MDKFGLPARYLGTQRKSVWEEYVQLAADYNPLDLGQGYSDFLPPEHIISALDQVVKNKNVLLHQYTRGCGHPRLVSVLSKLYSRFIGRSINPNTEILISAGAYGALYCTIMGHIDDGDEVIIIEPFFDCYESMVVTAGGTPRFVPLRFNNNSSSELKSSDWTLNPEELENAFNSRTKAIIINTPNNPLGKVFTESELQMVADLCKKWNVMCISDEVYEWLVYEPQRHVRMASLPGMWERTVTIGSAGKTYSITGWKIGWAYGPANLIHNLHVVHRNSIYACTTSLQEAIAIGYEKELDCLGQDNCYFISLPRQLEQKKNYMADFLSKMGMRPVIPDGGYFMVANWSSLEPEIDLSAENDKYKDYRFTKWLTKNVGIQGIPPSAFYSEPHKALAETLVRFCFIKQDEKLRRAARILEEWKATK
ncbi:hypothetical protein ILUMI_21994 [Ignelater luminosus]|uniref:Aminotransferase class I/classII large domain-containing protein n=1 Tax=Ignelater luminosus TaxID=2038154 RepID=A0A8K0CHL9_IGNLU|nr:hypothetical protein ILUMI_21994 [Ignelater luminosus]